MMTMISSTLKFEMQQINVVHFIVQTLFSFSSASYNTTLLLYTSYNHLTIMLLNMMCSIHSTSAIVEIADFGSAQIIS